MILVAVGWQVYAIHRNPLDLGLIGLVEFVPLLLLALPAGQLADVVPRRAIIAVSLVMEMAIALLLLAVTISGGRGLWPYGPSAGRSLSSRGRPWAGSSSRSRRSSCTRCRPACSWAASAACS